jgi:hypothetical protein
MIGAIETNKMLLTPLKKDRESHIPYAPTPTINPDETQNIDFKPMCVRPPFFDVKILKITLQS